MPIPENIKLVEATEATAIETSPAQKYGLTEFYANWLDRYFSNGFFCLFEKDCLAGHTPYQDGHPGSAAIEFAMTFPVSTFMQQHWTDDWVSLVFFCVID